jgi:hypothetical protein
MIKKEIRSLIKNLAPRLDKTSKYHNRFLDACIEKVLAEMYVELWSANPSLLDGYTKTYEGVTVLYEPSSTVYYSNVPSTIIPIPDKSSGVRHVYTATQGGNVFYPVNASEASWLTQSDTATVSSKIGYRVKQTSDTAIPRVDYFNMSASIYASTVRMDLLIPFSQYGDDDIILIPEIKNKEGLGFADRVLTLLSVIPPVDTKDNNIDTPAKG